MTGRLVLPGTAPEADWLEARRQGITASEMAIVMGLSPNSWDSPYSLYHRKRGELPEQADNDEMDLGRYLENYVARRFMSLRPEFGVGGNGRELYAHPDRPWQLATPDRLVHEDAVCDHGCGGHGDTGCQDWENCHDCYCCNFQASPGGPLAVLECKTDGGYDGWGDDGTDEIPVHYRCQVLWQMDVMGVTAGFVACLFLHSRKLRVYELALDGQAEADLKLMREEARDFLDRIDLRDPPDVDWRPATTDALKKLHPDLKDEDAVIPRRLGRAWLAACGRHKSAEQSRKRLENQIRERTGPAARAVLRDGTPIATRQVYEVKAHTRRASTTDKLVPVKPKEPK